MNAIISTALLSLWRRNHHPPSIHHTYPSLLLNRFLRPNIESLRHKTESANVLHPFNKGNRMRIKNSWLLQTRHPGTTSGALGVFRESIRQTIKNNLSTMFHLLDSLWFHSWDFETLQTARRMKYYPDLELLKGAKLQPYLLGGKTQAIQVCGSLLPW